MSNKLRNFTFRLAFFLLAMTIISTANAQSWHKASELPGTHRASAQELKTLRVQFSAKQIAYNFDDADTEVRIHPGDLTVSGALENDSLLIIQGDLTIKGNYHDYLSGIGVLVVLGQMQVENLYSWGAIYVQNDLNASGLILTVYNDFTFEVDGKVNARALVISDKSSDYQAGKIDVMLDDNDFDVEQQTLALRTFEPAFFTQPDHLELDADSTLMDLRFDDELGAERIADGGVIFRTQLGAQTLVDAVEVALSEASSAPNLAVLIKGDPLLAQLIAGRAELPATLHPALMATQDPIVLEWLARRAPKLVAAKLAQQEITPKLAEKLLEDSSLGAATLTAMATSTNAEVRATVARYVALDVESANRLALDRDVNVRVAAISFQYFLLRDETVSALVKDSSPAVRQEIAVAPLSYQDFQTLSTALDAEGLRRLAESLRSDAYGEREARMSEAERKLAIAALIANSALRDATALLLATAHAQQAAQFDALVQGKRLNIERLAAETRSIEVMQKIVTLADRLKSPLPDKLARNPNLPVALQRLILERAMAARRGSDDDTYGASPRAALDELMQQDGTSDEIVLETAKFALKEGYAPGDGGYQNSLFHRRNLPRSAIELLHAQLRGREDWALTLLLQRSATPGELSHAVARWYENAAINAELKRAEISAIGYWHALAKAQAKELREIAASNINTPPDVLIALTHDPDAAIAYSAQTHPNLPSSLRLEFALAAAPTELKNFPLSLNELEALLPKLIGARRREAMQLMSALR